MANAGYATLQLIPSLRGAEAAIAGELGGVSKSTEAAGATAGGRFGTGFTSKLAVVGPAAVGAVVVGLGKLGGAFDEQFDKIRVGTGATGSALDSLEGSFKNVLKTTATDFDTAGTAISDLNQKLGLTGPPLEALAKQFADVSRITGTDFTGNLDSGIKALQNFNVPAEAQVKSLDALYRASQASGISFSDLSGQMASSGVVLRQVGFDFDQSAILISALSKAGVDASDVMPGLSKAMATAAKEGKSAGDVFKDTFDKIKNAKSDTEAAGAAMDVFGAKAGPKLAALIREGKFSLDDMTKAVKDGTDTIGKSAVATEDWGEKWTKFKNNVLVLLEPIATKVFDSFSKGIDVLTEVAAAFDERGVSGAIDVLRGKFAELELPIQIIIGLFAALGVKALVSAAQTVAAWVLAETKAIASAVIHGVQFAFQIAQWVALGVAATVNAALIAAAWLISMGPIPFIVAAIVGLVVVVVKNWDTIRNAITTAAGAVLDFLKANWPLILAIITGPFGLVVLAIVKNWDTIKDAFMTGVRFVVDKFLGLVEVIVKGAATALGWVPGIGPQLKDAAKKFEQFRDDVNRALGGINDKVVQVKIQQKETGNYAVRGAFAKGGFVPGPLGSPQLILAHGGEYVVPLGQSDAPVMSGSRAMSNGVGGAMVHIDHATFEDEVDLDILFARAQFASMAGSSGG